MKNRVISVLMDNTPGVLSRISGLFSRRSYNIESITAGVTANPNITRMTIVCGAEDDLVLEQIIQQVAKLVDVRHIKVLEPGDSVKRELMMVKVKALPEDRQNVSTIAQIFRASIIDVGKDSMIIELTGEEAKLEAFLNVLGEYPILEVARTGLAGLSRGSDDVRFF